MEHHPSARHTPIRRRIRARHHLQHPALLVEQLLSALLQRLEDEDLDVAWHLRQAIGQALAEMWHDGWGQGRIDIVSHLDKLRVPGERPECGKSCGIKVNVTMADFD